MKLLKWFYPGLKIKRWVILLFLSLFFLVFSSTRFFLDQYFILRVFDVLLFIFSLLGFVSGIKYLVKSFLEAVYPQKNKEVIDVIYEKRFLSKGPKIVVVGGGTGVSTILEGLKEYTTNITAVIAVGDEGGSSGRLREDLGIPPPGDIRNCLVSLAETPQLMRDLFQYRFESGEGIKGHSFGNLFIAAMTKVTGKFEDAVKESSIVLAIRGRVIPSSTDTIRLKAEYSDGTQKIGEDKIPDDEKTVKRISLIPKEAKPNPEAIEAIKDAEVIVLGPGSLFTSIIPNLLIENISEEITNSKAIKIYICNVMTQHGETDGFTSSDHLSRLIEHSRKGVVNVCLMNSGRLKYKLLVKYAKERSFPVVFDRQKIKNMGISIFEGDVVSKTNYLRHDSKAVAKEIIKIYNTQKNV